MNSILDAKIFSHPNRATFIGPFLSRSLKCYSCSNKSTDTDDLHLIELTLHKDPHSFPL